jgi:hypothetical protein
MLDLSTRVRDSRSPDIPKDDPSKRIYFRRHSTLSFPGVTIANPLVVVRPKPFGGPDMIIGMEVLRRLHIYNAVKEQALYITSAASVQSSLPKDVRMLRFPQMLMRGLRMLISLHSGTSLLAGEVTCRIAWPPGRLTGNTSPIR